MRLDGRPDTGGTVMAKGFGKADALVRKQEMVARIRSAPPAVKALAEAAGNYGTLTETDWKYLAKDYGVLCSVFVEHECPKFDGHGGHYCVEEDGSVTALTFLRHKDTNENVGLVLKQTAAGTPDYHCVEVFTTEASGVSAVPEKDLDRAAEVAEETLNKKALAYSFAFDGKESGVRAGYAWTPGHAEEKVEYTTPPGCKAVLPIPISEHETTVKAIAFAHLLNRNAGVLFGGVPYNEIETVIEMGK